MAGLLVHRQRLADVAHGFRRSTQRIPRYAAGIQGFAFSQGVADAARCPNRLIRPTNSLFELAPAARDFRQSSQRLDALRPCGLSGAKSFLVQLGAAGQLTVVQVLARLAE